MEYNKAFENYKKIIGNIDLKIKERKLRISELNEKIATRKENLKSEATENILTGTIKKVFKIDDIQSWKAEIDYLEMEIEVLEEVKLGSSKEIKKSIKDLVDSVKNEEKKITDKEEKVKLLEKELEAAENELQEEKQRIRTLRTSTAYLLEEYIENKCPGNFKIYRERGLELFSLLE